MMEQPVAGLELGCRHMVDVDGGDGPDAVGAGTGRVIDQLGSAMAIAIQGQRAIAEGIATRVITT